MEAINKRGVFWLPSEASENGSVPDIARSGTLIVSEEGDVSVVLDGLLSGDSDLERVFLREEVAGFEFLLGVLKENSEKVLLQGLTRGGWRVVPGGFSHEEYLAERCFSGWDNGLHDVSNAPRISFSRISIALDSFRDWMELDPINVNYNKKNIWIRVELPKGLRAVVNDDLVIRTEYSYSAKSNESTTSLGYEVGVNAKFVLDYKKDISISKVENEFKVASEFFMLLAKSGCRYGWPEVDIGRGKKRRKFTMYFKVDKPFGRRPGMHDGFVYFRDVEDSLGQLYRGWMSLRSKVEAGAYLYFVSMAHDRFYSEHLYVSLIWGLECLHRRVYGDSRDGSEIKVDRMLDAISRVEGLKSDDRRCLKNFAKLAGEYSLEDRIFSLIDILPVSFEDESLRNLCSRCARLRNDISHYGGYREVGSKDAINEFYDELHNKILVLREFYGFLLLKLMGVEDRLIERSFQDSRQSVWLKRLVESVGLRMNGSDSDA